MITANFYLISSLWNPSSDTVLLTGVIGEVPKVGEQVTINSTAYIVSSISWVFGNPDIHHIIEQTANIRLLPLPSVSSS